MVVKRELGFLEKRIAETFLRETTFTACSQWTSPGEKPIVKLCSGLGKLGAFMFRYRSGIRFLDSGCKSFMGFRNCLPLTSEEEP